MNKGNVEQNICFECRHASFRADDDYRCEWFHDAVPVKGWKKDGRRVVRCPHFVEERDWVCADLKRSPKWKNLKPIRHCAQGSVGNTTRVVWLEKAKMYPSKTAVAEEFVKCGFSKTENSARAGISIAGKHRIGNRIRVFGQTLMILPHDNRVVVIMKRRKKREG